MNGATNMSVCALMCTAVLTTAALAGEDPCDPQLQIELAPTPEGFDEVTLRDVTVLSPNDIWAVGRAIDNDAPGDSMFTFIVHFDGTSWQIVPSPTPENSVGEHAAALEDVSFVHPDLGYAAGRYDNASNASDNLVLRWDGASWEQVPAPGQSGFGHQGFQLEAVEAINENNIWFGGGWAESPPRASMLRYNGSSFDVHLLPLSPTGTTAAHRIRAISALGPNDVWAAGASGGQAVAVGRNYVAHWDGSEWTRMDTPQISFGEVLDDIVAIAPDDVWVTGEYQIIGEDNTADYLPLFLHWDGKSWTQFESPAFAKDLVAFASDDIYGVRGGTIVHWDGNEWSIAEELTILPTAFNGIASVGPCDMVIVGSHPFSFDDSDPVVARFQGVTAPGDLNADGGVDQSDQAMLCNALGSPLGSTMYVPAADFNLDGVVNTTDQFLFNDILPPCAGDVVSSDTFQPPADGVTDGADLAYLLGAWGEQPSCADMVTSKTFQPPPDGEVDGADLAFLLGAWGACE